MVIKTVTQTRQDANCKDHQLDVALEDTIKDVKRKITDEKRIPVDQQQVIFDDKELEDEHTLRDYNIRHESTLSVLPRRESSCVVS